MRVTVQLHGDSPTSLPNWFPSCCTTECLIEKTWWRWVKHRYITGVVFPSLWLGWVRAVVQWNSGAGTPETTAKCEQRNRASRRQQPVRKYQEAQGKQTEATAGPGDPRRRWRGRGQWRRERESDGEGWKYASPPLASPYLSWTRTLRGGVINLFLFGGATAWVVWVVTLSCFIFVVWCFITFFYPNFLLTQSWWTL